jgi:hypothetical protein
MKMKVISISIISLLCFINVAYSQNWFNEEAHWVYEWYIPILSSPQPEGYEELTIGTDTIINNQSCKIVNRILTEAVNNYHDTIITVKPPFFVFEKNDSVYFSNGGDFVLIYDFTRSVGDSIIISGDLIGCDDDLIYTIDSLDILSLSGGERRIQYATILQNDFIPFSNQPIKIIEGVGMTAKLNPQQGTEYNAGYFFLNFIFPCIIDSDNDERWEFECFNDHEIEYNPQELNCYELPEPLSTFETPFGNLELEIFPNPVFSELNISLKSPNSLLSFNFQLLDLSGKLLKKFQNNQNEGNLIIPINNYPPGIYLLKIEFEGWVLATRRFVIQ